MNNNNDSIRYRDGHGQHPAYELLPSQEAVELAALLQIDEQWAHLLDALMRHRIESEATGDE